MASVRARLEQQQDRQSAQQKLERFMAQGKVWQGVHPVEQDLQQATVSTGVAALDECLHGGWQWQRLHEIQLAQPFSGELALLRSALTFCAHEKRPVFWVSPPALPFMPGLAFPQQPHSQHILLQPQSEADALWAVEQVLMSGSAGMVLLWQGHLTAAACRRLHLAVQQSGAFAVVISPEQSAEARAYTTRLRLNAKQQEVQVLKRSGGWPTTIHLPRMPFWKSH